MIKKSLAELRAKVDQMKTNKVVVEAGIQEFDLRN
jgi:hypothetical protein